MDDRTKSWALEALVAVLLVLVGSVASAQTPPPFAAARLWELPGTNTDATGLAVLMDVGSPGGGARDGILDVVAALQSQQLAVLFGRGDGSFETGPESAISGIPEAMAAADFNGDGAQELVIGDSSNFLTVLSASGGTLSPLGSPIDLQFFPRGIALGDFDRDGRMDILAVGETLRQEGVGRVLFGNGDGTFVRAAETLDTGTGTAGVATGDFNRDGNLDLVVINELTNQLVQFRGDGRGGFTVEQQIGCGGEGPVAVAVGDANRDGRPDVMVVNNASDNFAVALTQANGRWSDPRAFATGAPASSPKGLALGDVDGDGVVDAVVANNFSFDVGVLRGDGAGGFAPVRLFVADAEPLGVVVGRLDGDTRADVVALTRGSGSRPTAAVLRALGGNRLSGAENIPLGFAPSALAQGDIDGDGLLDLVVTQAGAIPGEGTIQVARGTARGSFDLSAAPIPSGGDGLAVVVGDFDGDFRAELAVVHANRSVAQLYRRSGRSFVRVSETPITGGVPKAVVGGDLNRDGRMDLAVASQDNSGGKVQVFLGRTDGSLLLRSTVTVGDFPLALALGDFNRDGFADIVAANNASVNLSVALGNGDGTFRPATSVGLPQAPRAVTVADFDRDGQDDVAVGVALGGTVHVLFGDGTGRFPNSINPLSVGSGEVVSGLAARDINGDGLPDILASGEVGNFVRVFLRNSGNPRAFTSAGSFGTNRRPVALVAGDYDGDGRYDAAAAASSPAPTTTVLTNVSPQGYSRGDANGDRRVGAADVVALVRKVGEYLPLRSEDASARGSAIVAIGADADGDGGVTTLDVPAVVAWAFR